MSGSSVVPGALGGLAREEVAGHGGADEAIALALLVLRAPFLAQLVCVLHSFHLLAGQLSPVAFASASRGLSNPRSCTLTILSLLVHHSGLFALLECGKRDGSAPVSQPLLHLAGVQSLLFNCLLDVLHIFALLVGSLVLLERMLLSEHVLLPPDLLESILDIRIDQRLFLFELQPLHCQDLEFFLLELIQFLPNVGIHEVCNVLAVVNLRHCVVLPLLRDDVVLLERDVEDSSASVFLLQLAVVWPFDLRAEVDLNGWSFYIVPLFGLRDIHAVEVALLCPYLVLFGDGLLDVEDGLARLRLGSLNAQLLQGTDFHGGQVVFVNPRLNSCYFFLREVRHPLDVHLIEHHKDRLVLEEGLNGVVEVDLLEHRVAALFRWVNEVNHAALEVGEGGDGLHFDGVHLLQAVIQDARGVNHLESKVVEVGVADVKRLGGEGVGLDLDVGATDAVDEAGLADIGIPGEEDGAFVRVDGGQSGHMLPYLLQVRKRRGDLPDHGTHATHGCPLERLAAIQRIRVLDQLQVIPAHVFYHVLGGLDMAECQLVVILIVEHVEEVAVEWMDVLNLGEIIEDIDQFLVDDLLAKLDLDHRRITFLMQKDLILEIAQPGWMTVGVFLCVLERTMLIISLEAGMALTVLKLYDMVVEGIIKPRLLISCIQRLYYMMEEGEDRQLVGRMAEKFAEYHERKGGEDELVAVFGHKEAGKSVMIDLLAGKQLKQLHNSEIGSTIIVRKDQQNYVYPSIYTQKVGKQTYLECFTLQEDIQKSQLTTELVKLQLLQQLACISSKLSLVLLIEDSQLSNTHIFIERFLHCLGINSNQKHGKIDTIKGYVSLIVTKAEGEIDDTKSILTELGEETENENVKEIIAQLIDQSAISHFQIKEPTKEVISAIKKTTMPKACKAQEIVQSFSTSILIEEAASNQTALRDFKEFREALKKITAPPPQTKAKPKPKAPAKKGPFYNFKQALQQKCSNNKEAIEFCLKTIKDKQKQEKYDYFDVIHYIKLLRDLLEEYDSQGSFFRRELLELALYTQDYYDFQSHLKRALANKQLTEKDATEWNRLLFSLEKYEYCEQLTDYLIADTTNDDNFQKLVYFKATVKGKIHAQFARGREGDKKAEGDKDKPSKKKELNLKPKDILSKKGRGRELESYFSGKSYEHHIA